jgi:hypothetical protein
VTWPAAEPSLHRRDRHMTPNPATTSRGRDDPRAAGKDPHRSAGTNINDPRWHPTSMRACPAVW